MLGKFETGTIVVTDSVRQAINESKVFKDFVDTCLDRYTRCDWGSLDDGEREQNDLQVREGNGLILANYIHGGQVLWITTTADRRYTTLLFPGEW